MGQAPGRGVGLGGARPHLPLPSAQKPEIAEIECSDVLAATTYIVHTHTQQTVLCYPQRANEKAISSREGVQAHLACRVVAYSAHLRERVRPVCARAFSPLYLWPRCRPTAKAHEETGYDEDAPRAHQPRRRRTEKQRARNGGEQRREELVHTYC